VGAKFMINHHHKNPSADTKLFLTILKSLFFMERKGSDEKNENSNLKPLVKEFMLQLGIKNKKLHLKNLFTFTLFKVFWYLNKVHFHFTLHLRA
jgi:hypothetical protein